MAGRSESHARDSIPSLMVLVDTSVWITHFAGTATRETEWLDRNIDAQRIGLTDLNLCELLQGTRTEEQFLFTAATMQSFAIFATGGTTLATASAKNYRILRRSGFTIRSTIDCLIATFCLLEGHSLLHRDQDFDAFERRLGLHVIHA
jgi:predicted nucleic acid-binding protein